MPGISSAKITTQGRLGSVRGAVIDFKVWDKAQLDIIDTLYFRLGYSIFIEWGHTNYYDNTGKLHSGEDSVIDPFSKNLDKDELRYQISEKVRESEGNYDAMLGVITNFSFSLNQEGGYDCTLNTISLGVLGESMRINNNNTLAEVLSEEVKQLVNILNKFEEARKSIENKNPTVMSPQGDPKADPSKQENYPDCVRKLGTPKLYNSASFTSNNSSYAISGVVGNSSYFFYLSGDYQTIDKKRKGSYSCNKNAILIDGIDPVSGAGSYEGYINSQDIKISSIFRGSKNQDEISSTNKMTNFNSPYGLIASVNNTHYIGLNKFKALIPTFLPDTNNSISVKFVNINSLSPIPTEEEIKNNENKNGASTINSIGENSIKYVPLVDKLVDNLYEARNIENKIIYKSKYNGEEYYVDFSLGGFNNSADDGLITNEKNVEKNYYSIKDLDNYPDIKNALESLIKKILSSGGNNYYKYNRYDNNKQNNKAGDFIFTLRTFINLNTKIETKIYNKITQTYQSQFEYKQVPYSYTIQIKTNDIDIISGIKFSTNADYNSKYLLPLDLNTIENIITPELPSIDLSNTQKDQSLKYNSDLEIILRTLQLDSFISISNKGSDITNLNQIYPISINETVKKLFEHGTFSNILNTDLLINNKKENYTDKDYKKANTEIRFKYHAAYGFHAGLLSNKISIKELNNKNYLVDYNKLMTRYVIPYKLSKDLFAGSNVNYPVYIPFGFFIMILNHSCLLYDIKDAGTKKQIPLIYIDFNPNSNICLSNESMLSTNPYRFMIPFEGTLESYKKIFPEYAPPTNIFHIESKDTISAYVQELSPFRYEDGKATNQSISKYRGKFMNVLVNVDYLLNIIHSHSTKDENNGVYLKAMLEEIISDMNKSFGNFNIFRLVYNDQADCFYISDDQLIPADNMVQRNPTSNTQKLNLFGKKSIALSLDIKTEVSSKLANMLAVSANSDTGDQSTAATEASSFGAYNISYRDRYKPIVKANLDNSGSSKETKVDIGMQVTASNNFNSAIESFYSSVNSSEDQVSSATNYYIERMSKIKNEDTATRASVMIPLSLNFSTDGISGLNMGQGFTIDDELLPSRYTSNGTFLNDKKDSLHKVGFIIVGLDHSIESNRWVSSVRANMFYLKDKLEYVGSIPGSKSNAIKFSSEDGNITIKSEDINLDNITVGKLTINKTEFVKKYYKVAKTIGDKFNIDPKIILSQAGHESAWGTSNLSVNHNNFFGFTAGGSPNDYWKGEVCVGNNQYKLKFRKYLTPQDGFFDFAILISSKYKEAYIHAKTDYKQYAYKISISPYITEQNGDDRAIYAKSIVTNYLTIDEIIKKNKIV